MEKLLQLLFEEAESAERSTWYGGGSDAKSESLVALMEVIRNVQRRIEEGE